MKRPSIKTMHVLVGMSSGLEFDSVIGLCKNSATIATWGELMLYKRDAEKACGKRLTVKKTYVTTGLDNSDKRGTNMSIHVTYIDSVGLSNRAQPTVHEFALNGIDPHKEYVFRADVYRARMNVDGSMDILRESGITLPDQGRQCRAVREAIADHVERWGRGDYT